MFFLFVCIFFPTFRSILIFKSSNNIKNIQCYKFWFLTLTLYFRLKCNKIFQLPSKTFFFKMCDTLFLFCPPLATFRFYLLLSSLELLAMVLINLMFCNSFVNGRFAGRMTQGTDKIHGSKIKSLINQGRLTEAQKVQKHRRTHHRLGKQPNDQTPD